MKKATILILLIVSFTGILTSCSNVTKSAEEVVNKIFTTSISDLNNNPQEYKDKTITIEGKVSSPVNIVGLSRYTLTDEFGSSIIVVGQEMVPATGATVKVTGKIGQWYAIGSVMNGLVFYPEKE